MAEKVIRNNESIVPFLGERLNFIRGLDPMGMQNTSDATFSLLLPGLNNVTDRIRYYSFYCWLLDVYSKRNGSTDPEEQKKFIRRAEFTIALASFYLKDGHGGIPGSQFAIQEIEQKGLTIHNLQEATFNPDGTTRGRYWTYPTGAFGQYYFGSLRSIGIITEKENHPGIYIRINKRENTTVSGEELANAFDSNISPETKELFLTIIDRGSVTENELKSLLPDFNLTRVPEETEEQKLLTALLIQKDYPLRIEEEPSTYRKQTIKHLLQYLYTNNSEEFSDRIFVYYCYYTKGLFEDAGDDCLLGWYYYQFNEFWHFTNTSILNGTLAYLQNKVGPQWMPIHKLVEEITNALLEFYRDDNIVDDENNHLETVLQKVSGSDEYDYFERTSKSKEIEKVANAFLLMFTLYESNKDELIKLKEFAENNEVAKDGEGTGYFITQFKAKKELAIRKFIYDYLHVNVIYRHQYVAFRKIRGGSQSTQKFIIEDLHIRYLGNFEATYTGPRVGNLIGFLIDLDVLTPEFELTDTGQNLLNTVSE